MWLRGLLSPREEAERHGSFRRAREGGAEEAEGSHGYMESPGAWGRDVKKGESCPHVTCCQEVSKLKD